jgi:twinkle protein
MKTNNIKGKAKLYGRIISDVYDMCFVPNFDVFSIGRKAARMTNHRCTPLRTIVSCYEIESVPVKCIEVDSPSSLFLCGRSYIPTHNSKFALRVAVNMARLHDWKFAFFPAESLPVSRFYNEIVEFYCEQPIIDADGVKMEQNKYFRAVEWVQKHFSCILPEEDPTLDSILSRSEVQIRRWGANAVVIDPWTEIYVQQQRNENRSEYIERALTKVTRFTKANNIHFFVVAHPAKPKDGAYGTKVPHPSDIAGSQMWYNKPDCIICPHRKDRTTNGVEIHVQKIRFREVGEYGMVNMVYNKWTGIYSPAYD